MQPTLVPTVLLVDDTEANRYAMGRMLRKANFLVLEAATGRQALHLASTFPQPDLIVLDVHLPDVDGFAVCEQLKAQPATAGIPILQLSAVYVRDEDKVHGLQGGADAYLTGPIESPVLVATIQALLRLRKMEAALRESEEKFTIAFQRNPVPMALLTMDGHYVDVNMAIEQSLGYTRLELLGRTTAELGLPRDPQRHEEFYQLLQREERIRDFEAEWKTKTGEHRTFVISAEPLTIQGKHYLLAVNNDITERKQAETELRRINAELQQFSYIVSHDLTEPLRTMRTYVQLLERQAQGKLDAEAEECMNFVIDGAQRMEQMLSDLLAYTRAGQPPTFRPVDCEDLLTRIENALSTRIAERGAVITHDSLPIVQGDATRLGQVLQNLIDNALKFCVAKPPRIHITATNDNQSWQFSVRDNGIGIDPRQVKRLFQVFQRAHGKEYSGTGIGLAICKKIVEQHGGHIWITSQPGEGTTVSFTIKTG